MTAGDVTEVLKKFKEAITPEMETPNMKGRGADLFARRRQRMERFVITDENRNQHLDRIEATSGYTTVNGITSNSTNKEGSIPSTPTTPNLPPKQSYFPPNNTLSGYFTDVDDQRPSYHQRNMRLNYFSDYEDDVECSYGMNHRKSRPAGRRAWETDVEEPYFSEAEPSFRTQAVHPSRTPTSPVIRRVPPPTKSFPGFQNKPQPLCTVLPAGQMTSFNETAVPKRTWSRVTFCPKKPSAARRKPAVVVAYPCAKKVAQQTRSEQSRSGDASHSKETLTFKPMFPGRPGNTSSIDRPKTLKFSRILPKINEKPSQRNIADEYSSKTGPKDESQVKTSTEAQQTDHAAVSHTHKSSATVTMLTNSSQSRGRHSKSQAQNCNAHSPDILSHLSKEKKHEESPNSNVENRAGHPSRSDESVFTTTVPSRCLTPTGRRPKTPMGVPKVIKIAGNTTLSPHPTESSPTPYNTPTPLELSRGRSNRTPVTSPTSDKTPADKKISACLNVLDPSRSLSLPKPAYHPSPSPTLNAVLKQETGFGDSVMALPRRDTRTQPERNWTAPAYPQQQRPMPISRPPSRPAKQPPTAPQPLGIIAEGMRGRGARMFEKQQKRMHNYTRETSKDSYPELSGGSELGSPAILSEASQFQFSPVSKTQPDQSKGGMRDVVGEFQKNSRPGKAKLPSETRRRTRDPLHYQQHLTYPPPSTYDFTSSHQGYDHYQSDTEYLPDHFQEYPSANDFVATPPSIPSPSDPRWTFGDDVHSIKSTSSISTQRSFGPKTAPKPSKAIIYKQLSRESLTQSAATTEDGSAQNSAEGENAPLSSNDCSSRNRISESLEDNVFTNGEGHMQKGTPGATESSEISRSLYQQSENSETSQPTDHTRQRSSCQGNDSNTQVTNGFRAPKPKFDMRKNGVELNVWSP